MPINFGEHEPMVEKIEVEREVVECKCGERLFVDEKFPIGEFGKYIRCKKCRRIYSPISYYRTGWDSCYILKGYLCQRCEQFGKELFKLRRDDPIPSVCWKCVSKELEQLPKDIEEMEALLGFLVEQVGETDGDPDLEG